MKKLIAGLAAGILSMTKGAITQIQLTLNLKPRNSLVTTSRLMTTGNGTKTLGQRSMNSVRVTAPCGWMAMILTAQNVQDARSVRLMRTIRMTILTFSMITMTSDCRQRKFARGLWFADSVQKSARSKQ